MAIHRSSTEGRKRARRTLGSMSIAIALLMSVTGCPRSDSNPTPAPSSPTASGLQTLTGPSDTSRLIELGPPSAPYPSPETESADDRASALLESARNKDKNLQGVEELVRQIGVSVVDANSGNRIAIKPAGGDQGIGLQAGELLVIAQAESRTQRRDTPLTSVAEMLVAGFGQGAGISNEEVASGLRDAIADASQSQSPTARLEAAIIRGGVPVSAWRDTDPGQIVLDPLQSFIAAYRFIVDLYVYAASSPSMASKLVFQGQVKPLPVRAAKMTLPHLNCSGGSLQSLVLDWHAAIQGSLFGKVLDLTMKNSLSEAELALNTILAVVKVGVYSQQWSAESDYDSSEVQRTKSNSKDGGEIGITASARFYPVDGQWVQCVRAALQVVGIDLDVVADPGRASSTSVNWELRKDPTRDMDPSRFGVCTDPCNPASAGAELETRSDAYGKTTVKVTGKRQKVDLSDKALASTNDFGYIQYSWDLKDTDPNAATYWAQVAVDLIGVAAAAGETGLGAAIVGGVNLLLRKWDVTRIYLNFKDWQPKFELRWHSEYTKDEQCSESTQPCPKDGFGHPSYKADRTVFNFDSRITLLQTDETTIQGSAPGNITKAEHSWDAHWPDMFFVRMVYTPGCPLRGPMTEHELLTGPPSPVGLTLTGEVDWQEAGKLNSLGMSWTSTGGDAPAETQFVPGYVENCPDAPSTSPSKVRMGDMLSGDVLDALYLLHPWKLNFEGNDIVNGSEVLARKSITGKNSTTTLEFAYAKE